MMYSNFIMVGIGLVAGGAIGGLVYAVLLRLKTKFAYVWLIGLVAAVAYLLFTWQTVRKKDILMGPAEGKVTVSQKITRQYWEKGLMDRWGKTPIFYYDCYQSGEEICVEVSRDFWKRAGSGENFNVVGIAGETETFHETGSYLSREDYQFDWFIMFAEFAAIIICLIKLLAPNFIPRNLLGNDTPISILDEDKP